MFPLLCFFCALLWPKIVLSVKKYAKGEKSAKRAPKERQKGRAPKERQKGQPLFPLQITQMTQI
jgi:hypothetical protein